MYNRCQSPTMMLLIASSDWLTGLVADRVMDASPPPTTLNWKSPDDAPVLCKVPTSPPRLMSQLNVMLEPDVTSASRLYG